MWGYRGEARAARWHASELQSGLLLVYAGEICNKGSTVRQTLGIAAPAPQMVRWRGGSGARWRPTGHLAPRTEMTSARLLREGIRYRCTGG